MEKGKPTENKLFLAVVTTTDAWQMEDGVIILSAKDKKEARKIVDEEVKAYNIKSIDISPIKPTKKPGWIYRQDPVIQ